MQFSNIDQVSSKCCEEGEASYIGISLALTTIKNIKVIKHSTPVRSEKH